MSDVADYSRGEPKPIPNDGPSIHDLVIADINKAYPKTWTARLAVGVIEERKQFGINKYGTILQANNGRNAAADAMDEIADALVYLRQAMEEVTDDVPRSNYSIAYRSAIHVALLLQVELHFRKELKSTDDID